MFTPVFRPAFQIVPALFRQPIKPYIFGMKRLCPPLSLLLLLSCGNNKPSGPSSSGPALIKDSAIVRRTPSNPYVQVDASPMDMAYFPADFPLKKMKVGFPAEPMVRVIYSRPHRGGRQLFGNLVAWGSPWRMGANEATEIEFFSPATVQGKKIERGRYVMYAVPQPDKWEVVLNRNLYTWGLKFDGSRDALRFDVPTLTNKPLTEHLTMLFEKTATGADLVMAWENTEARLPIQF